MKADERTLKLLGLQERGLAASDAAAEQAKSAAHARGDILSTLTTVVEKPGVKALGSRPIGDAPTCLEHLDHLVRGTDGLLYGIKCGCVFEQHGVVRVVLRRGE